MARKRKRASGSQVAGITLSTSWHHGHPAERPWIVGLWQDIPDLDNGYKREDSVKDIGALLDWIATQPDLDANRVLVTGGSYGGYMTPAVSTNYPDRIAGAIDSVGISHFVTSSRLPRAIVATSVARNTATNATRRCGEFLHSISPLTNAHKIKKAAAGGAGQERPARHTPKLSRSLPKARGNGSMVWYLRAENEGHGFARKENADYYFYAMVRFMQETILK